MLGEHTRNSCRRIAAALLLVGLLTGAASSPAQNEKKKKKKNDVPAADAAGSVIPLSEDQRIDYIISEVLGAWQIGDTERMHKNYADDVSVVKGTWEAPVVGWTNYEALDHAAGATRPRQHLHQGERRYRLGLFPMGFFGCRGWRPVCGARADNVR